MGNTQIQRVNFEDVQAAQQGSALLINVLDNADQSVLIAGTVSTNEEVESVEDALRRKFPIIVYGRNANDEAVYAKMNQLKSLGAKPYLYTGGLFEWLLMQDIYGQELFPTKGNTVDLLQYKPSTILSKRYLTC